VSIFVEVLYYEAYGSTMAKLSELLWEDYTLWRLHCAFYTVIRSLFQTIVHYNSGISVLALEYNGLSQIYDDVGKPCLRN